MEISELVDNYRAYSRKKRILIACFLLSLPEVWRGYSDGELLWEELSVQEQDLASIEKEKDVANKKKDELPSLVAKVDHTQILLEDARKKLPDSFQMDKVLSVTAKEAKKSGIKIRNFDPLQQSATGTIYKYAKLPISLNFKGAFTSVANFLDRLVHLEMLVKITNLRMSLADANNLEAVANMVVFRSLTDKERISLESKEEKRAEVSP